MPPISCLLFDLDGTLVDSADDIVVATHHTLRAYGKPLIPRDQIIEFIGRGALLLLKDAFQEAGDANSPTDDAFFEEVREKFLGYYLEHAVDRTRLYPGTLEMLAACRERRCAVVTNKPLVLTERVLTGLDVTHFFSKVIAGDSLPRKKPDPLQLLTVLEEFGIPPERALMVGDSAIDIEAGKRAGTQTCAMTHGFRPLSELQEADPDCICDAWDEMLAFLNENTP